MHNFFPAEQKKLMRKEPHQPNDSRILNIAIIGSPNAGKSTLANKLLGWKVRFSWNLYVCNYICI